MAYGDPVSDLNTINDSVDLLARLIYSEAEDQAWVGKQGVAHIARNRKADGYWGSTYKQVLLYPYQFEGMTTNRAKAPTTSSQAWKDSLFIAQNVDNQVNPIGTRMYFLPVYPTGHKNILQIGGHWFFD